MVEVGILDWLGGFCREFRYIARLRSTAFRVVPTRAFLTSKYGFLDYGFREKKESARAIGDGGKMAGCSGRGVWSLLN